LRIIGLRAIIVNWISFVGIVGTCAAAIALWYVILGGSSGIFPLLPRYLIAAEYAVSFSSFKSLLNTNHI
jgi:hypothetical protein